jgi:hypothetical protein
MAIADRQQLSYTLAGLQAVAAHASGRPRDAVKNLGLVAATGQITPDAVEATLNHSAGTIATRVFASLINGDMGMAVTLADELSQRVGPVHTIGSLFSSFARDNFTGGQVAAHFAPLRDMTQFFLKWAEVRHLPSDIIPLFVLELHDMLRNKYQPPAPSSLPTDHDTLDDSPRREVPPPEQRPLTAAEVRAMMED